MSETLGIARWLELMKGGEVWLGHFWYVVCAQVEKSILTFCDCR